MTDRFQEWRQTRTVQIFVADRQDGFLFQTEQTRLTDRQSGQTITDQFRHLLFLDRQTDRQTDSYRQTERVHDIDSYRHYRSRQTDRQDSSTVSDRQTDRQTDRLDRLDRQTVTFVQTRQIIIRQMHHSPDSLSTVHYISDRSDRQTVQTYRQTDMDRQTDERTDRTVRTDRQILVCVCMDRVGARVYRQII